MKTHQVSKPHRPHRQEASQRFANLVPILGVIALTLIVGAAAAINLHRSDMSADVGAAKSAHHMASLGEIKALVEKARENTNQ